MALEGRPFISFLLVSRTIKRAVSGRDGGRHQSRQQTAARTASMPRETVHRGHATRATPPAQNTKRPAWHFKQAPGGQPSTPGPRGRGPPKTNTPQPAECPPICQALRILTTNCEETQRLFSPLLCSVLFVMRTDQFIKGSLPRPLISFAFRGKSTPFRFGESPCRCEDCKC